jgi:hypothetical protein
MVYPLLSAPNFLVMIDSAQVAWPLLSITFQACSLVYTLKRAHMWAIFLCCAMVSQLESFLWCTHLAALFFTQSNTFICPSLQWSQHAASCYRIGRTSGLLAKRFGNLFPFLKIHIVKWSAFQAFLTVQFTWSAQLKSLRKTILKYLQLLASGITMTRNEYLVFFFSFGLLWNKWLYF